MDFPFRRACTLPVVLLALMSSAQLNAATALDAALSELVRLSLPVPPGSPTPDGQTNPLFGPLWADLMQGDDAGRVLVDLYLDGTSTVAQASATLATLGGTVTGVNPDFRYGIISAYVPLAGLQNLNAWSGIRLINLAAKPQTNAGKVTSQGTAVMRSDFANAGGFTGAGITVGVLSDTYDRVPGNWPPGAPRIRASTDIASGDLPVPKLIVDHPSIGSDEGRAMMQIVHDVAPDAGLCFATAFQGEASFASNIRMLRTHPLCQADVIVDDVFYYDEPMFSDGPIAQAVNDVVTSATLAGRKVAYFSSAGNQQGKALTVAPATFSTTPAGIGNIDLSTVGSCYGLVTPATGNTATDIGGGFLDFGGGNYAPAFSLKPNSSVQLIVQWDDPFYRGAVTTDLNVFFFDSQGACTVAAVANNIATTDNGHEMFGVNYYGATQLDGRIMIARTSAGSKQANRVKMVLLSGAASPLFGNRNEPATFGHNSASNAISVAAYKYSVPYTASPWIPALESFSSPGPATIVFDANGLRLSSPETRKKPDIAAPDGVDTTFFYALTDPDGTGYPNFSGTSAAAPHAAGVAALMLQKGGGPGALSPAQIKSYLQNSAPARVLPYTIGPASKSYGVFDGFGLIDAMAALGRVTPR